MHYHFTDKFRAAFARVQAVHEAEGIDAARVAFRNEMLALGHVERVRNLYRVRNKLTSKTEFFVPNRAQEEYLAELPKRSIILKTRQLGFTTLEGIRELDYALFEPNFHSGIMAHKQDAVKKLFEKCVKFPYERFVEDWGHLYSPALKNDNTTTLFFEHDGLGRALNSSVSVAFEFRSGSLNILHVSEAAFVANDRLGASVQTVPETGEVIYESTPNGRGGDFYQQWQHWKKLGPLAPFRGFFFPWFVHYPEDREDPRWGLPKNAELSEEERRLQRDFHVDDKALAWRRWKIVADCQNDIEVFNREYPTDDDSCFYNGEALVFPASVTQAQSKFVRPSLKVGFLWSESAGRPKFEHDPSGFLTIWEEPQSLDSYVIGADPSQGVGRDRAAAYVINQRTGRIAARIWGQLSPEDFGNELFKLAHYYNKAWICWERNNHGHVVTLVLRSRGYPHLYRGRAIDAVTGEEREEHGWLTNNESKLVLTEKFKNACKSGEVQIVDEDLIDEMTTFVQVATKTARSVRREATSGNHDDLVMAAALAWEMNAARPVTQFSSEPTEATPTGYDASFDESGFPQYE